MGICHDIENVRGIVFYFKRLGDSATEESMEADDSSRHSNDIMHVGIVIVGGGIGGLATALALHRSGLKSLVLERADMLRASGTALTLWTNAWRALDALGISHSLRPHYPSLSRMRFLKGDGSTLMVEGDFRHKDLIHEMRCVERKALLEALAKPLPKGTIRFHSQVVAIYKSATPPYYFTLELRDKTTIHAKVLIGCDGIHSVVAKWMGLPEPTRVSKRYTIRGMAVYNNMEGHGVEFAFKQVLGNNLRLGLLPVSKSHLYWFITHRKLQRQGIENVNGDPELVLKEALDLVRGMAADVVEMVKRTERETVTEGATDQVRWVWPIPVPELLCGSEVECPVALVGDAMHAMTPDIGQGGCLALEDAVVLGRSIAEWAYQSSHGCMWRGADELGGGEMKGIKEAVDEYTKQRRRRVFGMQVRSWVTGEILDGNWWFTRFLRHLLLKTMSPSSIFVKHTQFEFGSLPSPSSI